MKNYAEIFESRGKEHAEAFRQYPNAITEEAQAILKLADLQPDDVVLDLPAASGFLRKYVHEPQIRWLAVEPSKQLYDLCKLAVEHSYCAPLTDLPLPDEHVDAAISLAGLHHEQDLDGIFREVFRVLRKGGRFAIAEVNANSRPADFLNGFVDQYSSTGHAGIFASEAYRDYLLAAGFRVTTDKIAEYYWRFGSVQKMADCLKLMFGIDLANSAEIAAAVSEVLGLDELPDGSVGMRWSLRHMLCTKNLSR